MRGVQVSLPAIVLPPCTAALHAKAHERFARGFHGAAADRQSMKPRFGVMHERGAVLEVPKCVADRPVADRISRVAHAGDFKRFNTQAAPVLRVPPPHASWNAAGWL